jgi:glycosyltransferase involved in cell wall biosynthesis
LKSEAIAFAPSVRRKIFVISNGIDIREIERQKAYEYPRKYILFVGRLHPVKGIDTLIEAFQRIMDRTPQLDLLVVGTGPLDRSLHRMVAERGSVNRIIFLGDRERSEVYALLKGCEFLVLPSHREGCPMVVLEAMAAGKITIGSKVKGIVDLVKHETTGVLFQADHFSELSDLILQYYSDHTRRAALEDNIKGIGLEMYDIQRLCDKHLEVYAGLRRKLRICLISAFYYQDEACSGLSSYYFVLAESLIDLGHELHLVTSENGSFPSNVATVPVAVRQRELTRPDPSGVGGTRFRALAARLLFSLKAYLSVRELDRSVGIDVIVAPELFAPALLVGFLMGSKLVTRLHAPTYIGDHFNQRYRYEFVGRLLSLPEKAQAKRSTGLSVASERLASIIAADWSIPRETIQVIPNSVRIDWVRQLAAQQPREISGEYLLYFGRLEKLKGVHVISAALSQVFSERPDIMMVFIGKDCGLKEMILRDNHHYRDKIIFLDTVEKGRLFGAIRYAKLVLLPSLFENQSNAALEAMALGRPIIGTPGTFSEQIIEDNINGFVVEPGDPRALSARIVSCLRMDDLDRIGQNAYRSIAALDSKRIALRNVEFYRDAIGLAKPR